MARTKRLVMVVAIVALVVLAGCSGGAGDGGGAPPGANGGANGGAGDGAGSGGSGGGGGGGGGSGDVVGASVGASYFDGDRRVIVRQSRMTVRVGEFGPAFSEVRGIVEGHGGFVQDYSIDVERGWHTATMRLRVPADTFLDVRGELAGLGAVEDESVSAEDFSDERSDRDDRLADLRAKRAELQQQLENTDDADRERRLRAQISDLDERIEAIEEKQAALDRRAALSTIELTIHEPVGDKPPQNYRTAYGFDDAFLEAFYGGLVILKTTVVLLGYLASIGVAILMFAVLAVVSYRAALLFARLSGLRLPGGGSGGGGGGGSGGTGGSGGGGSGSGPGSARGPGRLGGETDPGGPTAPDGTAEAD